MINKGLLLVRVWFVPLAILSYLFGAAYWIQHFTFHESYDTLIWKMTQYHVNFIDFGFAKRAVVGTLLYPVMSAFPDGELGEYITFAIADFLIFLVGLLVIASVLKRVQADHPEFTDWTRVVLLTAPVAFMQLGADSGRYDHYNFLIVFLAVYFVLSGRIYLAGLLLAFGVFVHEAIFFYGIPIITILALLRGSRVVDLVGALVPVVVAMAMIFLFGNLDIDLTTFLNEKAAV